MSPSDIIKKTMEDWYLLEPALFQACCSHELIENPKLYVPYRSGKMRIEYNQAILSELSDADVAELLKIECIRILLGHPYQRQPYQPHRGAMSLGSDLTIRDNYKSGGLLPIPEGLICDKGLTFEEYYAIAKKYLENQDTDGDGVYETYDQSGDSDEEEEQAVVQGGQSEGEDDENDAGGGENNEDEESHSDEEDGKQNPYSEKSELWEEDEMAKEQIREMIANIQRTKQWGSLPGSLQDVIIASAIVRIDYRRILSFFRATILSSKRRLTRMRPSRRYGFENMGSKRDFCTRMLVAIDTSGSVDNAQISQALSIINRFFKYGVEDIDVIQFDYELQGEKVALKKALKKWDIHGRGGTDFQAPVDMFIEEKYDALIMITDGYAPVPKLPENFIGHILWMIYENGRIGGSSRNNLDKDLQWINELRHSRYLILPPVK